MARCVDNHEIKLVQGSDRSKVLFFVDRDDGKVTVRLARGCSEYRVSTDFTQIICPDRDKLRALNKWLKYELAEGGLSTLEILSDDKVLYIEHMADGDFMLWIDMPGVNMHTIRHKKPIVLNLKQVKRLIDYLDSRKLN